MNKRSPFLASLVGVTLVGATQVPKASAFTEEEYREQVVAAEEFYREGDEEVREGYQPEEMNEANQEAAEMNRENYTESLC
jgi:hypothetical protein